MIACADSCTGGLVSAARTEVPGAAAVVERGGLTVAIVLLSWRWLELEPVSRRIDAGSWLQLRGRLLGEHRSFGEVSNIVVKAVFNRTQLCSRSS